MKEKTTPEHLAVIDTELKYIRKDIDDIKSNHLHSIYSKFDDIWKKFNCFERKLTTRLPLWATSMITILSSLSVGLIVYSVMKK